jgi:hypothetical protein
MAHKKTRIARSPTWTTSRHSSTRLEKIAYRFQILVGAIAFSMLALLGAIELLVRVWRVM